MGFRLKEADLTVQNPPIERSKRAILLLEILFDPPPPTKKRNSMASDPNSDNDPSLEVESNPVPAVSLCVASLKQDVARVDD